MWRTCVLKGHKCFAVWRERFLSAHKHSGRITLLTVLTGTIALGVGMFAYLEVGVSTVSADDVTTSVTVLNTPPVWTVAAEESTESSTSTPTNAGTAISWVGTGTDSNNEDYFLLICKTSASPTASSNAPPSCGGGVANQWAVSATTTSGSQATAATTTIETFPFDAESNDWYAWICDTNASLARCNTTFEQGSGSTASPFVMNHPPLFSAILNDGPVDPGSSITWTPTASDLDSLGGSDTVQLFVCRAADFTGSFCGAGGSWATSTLSVSNPATTTTIAIPTQDAVYDAYVYIVDEHGLQATSTIQASNSSFTVSNVAPSVTAATVSLVDTDDVGDLTLLTPNATSGPFKVTFEATDNNSCQNSGAGDEIASAIANVYRSGVTSASCDESGEYDANNCYVAASPLFSDLTCVQDGGTCSGSSDTSVTWTCTFALWYTADPTDVGTPYTAQNWLASVRVTDDDTATSTLTEATTGNEMTSFLAFDVTETAISYGGLEPGQQNDPIATTTDLIALGNVGLDEDLYGDGMCTTWSAPDSCPVSATSTIPVGEQRFATSSVAYASATALTASTSPTELEINVPKTTSTSSPATRDTYWGINIPGTITLAGDYTGQNTITAIVSEAVDW